jgi:hypothetical protein
LKKYGVENPMQLDFIKEKIRQTNLERCGFDNPSKSPEIRNKIIQNNLKKYGVEHPMQLDFIKEKIRQTNLERYGFDNPSKSPEIRNKIIQTFQEKYGKNSPTQTTEIKNIIKDKLIGKFAIKLNEYLKELDLEILGEYEGTKNYCYWKCLKCNHVFYQRWYSIQQGILFDGLYWHSEKFISNKNYHLEKTLQC